MERARQFLVPAEQAGWRLDLFLTENLPGYSRSKLKRLIEAGGVTVEGKRGKAHRRLKAGEKVDILLPSPGKKFPLPQFIPLDLLYEDGEILVVNKPPGITVHPVREGGTNTLLNALLFRGSPLSSIGAPLRAGIVHRLDKDTSGVLVVAKSDSAHLHLTRQFKERKVGKEYRAVVRGQPPRKRGELTYPIGRSRRRPATMKISYFGGRAAITEYEILEKFRHHSLLRLELKTGRTHQIRLHLAQIGCPVLGDRRYGSRNREKDKNLEVERQMLHAYRLRILHPTGKKKMEFIAPLPGDMKLLLTELRERKGDKDRKFPNSST